VTGRPGWDKAADDEGGQQDNRDWHLSLLERRWALGCLLAVAMLAAFALVLVTALLT